MDKRTLKALKGSKVKRMWGGFSDDKLFYEREKYSDEKIAAVFFSRAAARRMYQDVRPVFVIIPKPKPRKSS